MDTLEALNSWMAEAVRGLPATLYDPKGFAAIFAILVLMILYKIVSSLGRLRRQVEHLAAEVAALRSSLKKIEWALGRIEEKRSVSDPDRKPIFTLPLRDDLDKTEWK